MKKKFFNTSGFLLFITIIFLSFTAFDHVRIASQSVAEKNSCTIIIKSNSGTLVSGIKISGDVCGAISCMGNTGNVYTDKNGEATVRWSDGCRLCYIFVNGKSHKNEYKSGETYHFII